MFGASFQYEKPLPKAKPGEYEVIIKKVEERSVGGYPVLTFTIGYKDGIERIPKAFDIFDVTDPTNERARKAFNSKMSKIVDCFALSGSFDPQSYAQWVGHSGWVYIKATEDGFLNVADFLPRE